MQMRHSLVISALLAATLAGCQGANSFQSINDTFKTVKTTSAGLKHADMAAGAIATNLAAMEVLSAISVNQSNVIAAGAGNVIAAGAGNYGLLQAGGTTGEGDAVSPTKDSKGNPNVKLKYKYAVTSKADGTQRWELSEVKGDAYGYGVMIKGAYDFTPDSKVDPKSLKAGDPLPGTATGTLSGSLSLDGKEIQKIENLSFNTSSPLPDTIAELGKVVIADLVQGVKLDLTVSRNAKVFAIKGTYFEKDVAISNIEADETNIQNPKITPIAKK
jgi:hypothetical protein